MSHQKKSNAGPPGPAADLEAVRQMLQQERDRLQLLQQITAAANEADTVAEAFQTALDLICEYTKWPLAHVFMPDVSENGNVVLASSGIWFCGDYKANDTFAFFRDITAQTTFSAGQGWLGRIFAGKVPAWSVNVLEEPDFLHNHRLRDLNVRAGFAFPVLSGDEVVALMEFYAPETMEPDEEMLSIMANIGTQLGRVVERERAADKLRRREMLLAEAQSVAQMGGWEVDAATRTVRATDQLYEVLGVDPDTYELTRNSLLTLVHPDDQPAVISSLERIFRHKEPWNVRQRLVRPDGAVRYLHVRIKPVLNDRGRIQRVIGIAQDVTERHELELSLERSLAFLEEAQRLAQLGNWEYDLETNTGVFSNQVYRIHGLDPEKDTITQKLLFEMEHPDDREATRQRLRLVRENKQAYATLYRIVLPDGEIRYLEAYVEPVLDAAGEVTKLRGTIQNVTERKEAEEKIQKQIQRLAFLHEVGQAVVSTLDLDNVLNRALETLRPLLNAEGVFVLLREGEKEMYFAATDHIGDGDLTGVRVISDHGVAGAVIRSGKPEWISGEETPKQVFAQIEQVAGYTTRSIISVPLTIHNRIIGVAEAVHRQPDAFTQEDLMLLVSASSWIAIAIENARLYGEVEMGQTRFRELADELVWTQEEERRRIAGDLHDDVSQGMVALEIQLELLQSDIKDEALRPALKDAKKLIGDITQRLRTLAYNLRPPELDTIGLNAALTDLCQVYEKQTNLSIHFSGTELPRQVSDTITISLYRFLQEALINISQHAAATRVEVKLAHDDGVIHLRVSDNGRGFNNIPHSLNEMSGLGLLGMRERFATLNGSIQITSTKGIGTEVIARVPW